MADGGMFSGFSEGFSSLLQNKDFIRAMAGTGAALDPQGVGGALGGATQDMIGSQAQQANFEALLRALGPGGKVNVKPDGSTSVQVGQPESGQPAQSQLGTLGEQPQGQVTTTSGQTNSLLDDSLGSMIDTFYQQLMGGGQNGGR